MNKNLYLHVPFCESICFYCDFKRCIYKEEKVNNWLKKIKEEIDNKDINIDLETIYLGGGTPSCLNIIQLETLLKILQPYSIKVLEYTIESNIESLDKDKIILLKNYRVNRISLGVQSLHDSLLKEMNRKHTQKDVFDKIEEIYHLGIHNISIDLIYGFENQSIEMWKEDLLKVVSKPYLNHISLYSLTIEENSVFHKLGKSICDNEIEAKMYDIAISILEKNGFKQYEIANFAKDNKESIHNQTYWNYDNFYGVGVGASGKEDSYRYTNEGSVDEYLNGEKHLLKEELSKEDCMFENIMMSLRMKKGLNMELFDKRYQCSFREIYDNIIKECIRNDELIIEENNIKVTKHGMFYLHDVLIKFMR